MPGVTRLPDIHLDISVDSGGWLLVWWTWLDVSDPHEVEAGTTRPLLARVAQDAHDRWYVDDLWLHGGPLTTTRLRELPVAAIEQFVNAPHAVELRARLNAAAGAAPRLDFKTAVAQFPSERDGVIYTRTPRERLAPPKEGLTDDFLRAVAAAYNEHVAARRYPAPAIKQEVGGHVSKRTVHHWITRARQRGFLPKHGQKGRAG